MSLTEKLIVDKSDNAVLLQIQGDSRTIQMDLLSLVEVSKYFETLFSLHDVELSTKILVPFSFDVLHKVLTYKKFPIQTDVEKCIVALDFLQMTSALEELIEDLYTGLTKSNIEDLPKSTVQMLLRQFSILLRYEKATSNLCSLRTLLTVNGKGKLSCDNNAQLYIAYHFRSIMYDRAVLQLDCEALGLLLSSDFLRISEEQVLAVIKIWINQDYKDRQQYYGQLLRCLRFDEKVQADFILEEVLDFAPSDAVKDYVISVFGKRLGCKKLVPGTGPVHDKPRFYRTWEDRSVALINLAGA